MNSLIWYNRLNFNGFRKFISVLSVIFMTGSAWGQNDPFGEVDLFYIDSVEVGPGQDVSLHFYLKNDETLSSISLPITYNPNVLKIKSVSFSGSRIEYIANKIVTPSSIDAIDGHFVMSLFILFEDPVPAGDGLIFTALFTVSDSAEEGVVSIIDSLYYPPGGELIFVESSSAQLISPAFIPGKVFIKNKPPVFSSIPSQYIYEGDSLVLNITASDLNDDSLVMVCSNKPAGATFIDNKDGTAAFYWQPEYIGPYSADGSPFELNLWVSDGNISTGMEVIVNVVNKNRKPVITLVDTVKAEAGELVEFTTAAYDPDLEPLTWLVTGLPESASFDFANPGYVSWPTLISDTGLVDVVFIVSDPQGATDTSITSINITPSAIYSLILDTASAYPGDRFLYDIILDNKLPIGSFNLLINYDPSALIISTITNGQTRTSGFEYFNVVEDEDGILGNVRIEGIADTSGNSPMPLLGIGDGSIAMISFRIVGNISFSGMYIPIRFRFLDDITLDDNTLTDSAGNKIEQSAISYSDGYVGILSLGELNIGDINLNGIAYEIGDVIYFTNYFMNPILYPLNPLQYANSDINQDNIPATIGDLVALINIIVGGSKGFGKTLAPDNLSMTVRTELSTGGMEFIYDADFEVGAIFMTLQNNGMLNLENIKNYTADMNVSIYDDSSEVRMLIYSPDGYKLPAGENRFIGIDGLDKLDVKAIEVASADGNMAEVALTAKNSILPRTFNLYQNYPNPFNPETHIDFDLPQNGRVMLTVYNILGEKVKIIIDNELPAGTHSVVWDSRDNGGSLVASGIYLYRLETEVGALTRKMMLLK